MKRRNSDGDLNIAGLAFHRRSLNVTEVPSPKIMKVFVRVFRACRARRPSEPAGRLEPAHGGGVQGRSEQLFERLVLASPRSGNERRL